VIIVVVTHVLTQQGRPKPTNGLLAAVAAAAVRQLTFVRGC
jgi:hypothetical protein